MKSIEDKFYQRTDRSGECWLWTGKKTTYQYPILCHNGEQFSGRRISFEMYKGPINGQKVICNCGERSCVNPDHLFLGNIGHGHKVGYKTKVFPTNNIEILAAAVCVDCGGPRSIYSAQRCLMCYLAKAKLNREIKARARIVSVDSRLARKHRVEVRSALNTYNIYRSASSKWRFQLLIRKSSDRYYQEIYRRYLTRHSRIEKEQDRFFRRPRSFDSDLETKSGYKWLSSFYDITPSSALSPDEILMRKEEDEEWENEQKYLDWQRKKLSEVPTYQPALVYGGTLSRIDPRPCPLPSEFGRDAQRMFHYRRLHGNGDKA